MVKHPLVTSLDVLLSLDPDEMTEGHLAAERGDPEPGMNSTLAYCHGWRTRMYDLGELPIPAEHRALVRAWLAHQRRTA